MYTVYQHLNKINGKIYIGMTGQAPEKRWGSNGVNYKTSPHFYSAIQKYGWDNFEHNILYDGLTKEEACNKEIELIQKYNTMDSEYGYNQTTGGECFELSEDARIKKSKSMIGNKNSLGKPCSVEKANKIRDAQIGKKLSEEHKKKLSNSAKNRHVKCSDEKKEILRNSHPRMKKVYCVETDTVYKSVQECGRQLCIDASFVSYACRNNKPAHGFNLNYYTDDTIKA